MQTRDQNKLVITKEDMLQQLAFPHITHVEIALGLFDLRGFSFVQGLDPDGNPISNELIVSNEDFFSDATSHSFAENLANAINQSNVKTLTLDANCGLKKAALKIFLSKLSENVKIESLHFKSCFSAPLSSSNMMREDDMWNLKEIEEALSSLFSKNIPLKHFTYSGNWINNAIIEIISKKTTICSLDLSHCSNMLKKDQQAIQFSCLMNNRNLLFLNLTNVDVTEETLQSFDNSSLMVLHLSCDEKILANFKRKNLINILNHNRDYINGNAYLNEVPVFLENSVAIDRAYKSLAELAPHVIFIFSAKMNIKREEDVSWLLFSPLEIIFTIFSSDFAKLGIEPDVGMNFINFILNNIDKPLSEIIPLIKSNFFKLPTSIINTLAFNVEFDKFYKEVADLNVNRNVLSHYADVMQRKPTASASDVHFIKQTHALFLELKIYRDEFLSLLKEEKNKYSGILDFRANASILASLETVESQWLKFSTLALNEFVLKLDFKSHQSEEAFYDALKNFRSWAQTFVSQIQGMQDFCARIESTITTPNLRNRAI